MNFFFRHRVLFGIVALAAAVVFAFGVCFFALARTASGAMRQVIVIDAGHGGVDGGVVGTRTGVKESDINLAVSRLLRRQFEDAGFLVVETRPTEAGLYGAATAGYKKRDMQKRAKIINEVSPAAVISVHQNFFPQDSARRGAQVFYREGGEGKRLAEAIQTALNKMPECVKPSAALAGDYFVLNCSDAPSVIVECGFLSNPEDEALLVGEPYRRRIAETIAEGTCAFLLQGHDTLL